MTNIKLEKELEEKEKAVAANFDKVMAERNTLYENMKLTDPERAIKEAADIERSFKKLMDQRPTRIASTRGAILLRQMKEISEPYVFAYKRESTVPASIQDIESEDKVMQDIIQFINDWYPRPFYSADWVKLKPIINQMAEDQGKDYQTALNEILANNLLLALENFIHYQSQPPVILGTPKTSEKIEKLKGYQFPSIWRWLLQVLRLETERGLLDGATLKSEEYAKVDNGLESTEDTHGVHYTIMKPGEKGTYIPKKIDKNHIDYITSGRAFVPGGLNELAQCSLDTIPETIKALAKTEFYVTGEFVYLNFFNGEDRLILAAQYMGYNDDELAKHFGITEGAIRKRRQRLRAKIG